MSITRKLIISITSLLVFSGLMVSCTPAEQYTFFVTLGDDVTSSETPTLEEAGRQLAEARASWTPETATPAQNAVLTELSRQAQEREQAEAWYRGVEAHRRQIQLHPFLTCVRHHESDRGSYPHTNGYHIGNGHGLSTSSGAYQFVDGTWRTASAAAGYPGYARALHAPWYVQDAVAYHLAITRGQRFHWNGTGC